MPPPRHYLSSWGYFSLDFHQVAAHCGSSALAFWNQEVWFNHQNVEISLAFVGLPKIVNLLHCYLMSLLYENTSFGRMKRNMTKILQNIISWDICLWLVQKNSNQSIAILGANGIKIAVWFSVAETKKMKISVLIFLFFKTVFFLFCISCFCNFLREVFVPFVLSIYCVSFNNL